MTAGQRIERGALALLAGAELGPELVSSGSFPARNPASGPESWASVVPAQAAAAAANDLGLRSTLAINQYSPYGICDTLDWRGYPPDEITARWADGRGGDGIGGDRRGLLGATIIRGIGPT